MNNFGVFVANASKLVGGFTVLTLWLSSCAIPGGSEADRQMRRDDGSVYTAGIPASVDEAAAKAGIDCSVQRPEDKHWINRPYVHARSFEIKLFSRPTSDCPSKTTVGKGKDIWVLARQNNWAYIQGADGAHEGWASSVAFGDLQVQNDCFDLEWSSSGMRIKNQCDRDVSEMRVCLMKRKNEGCRTNWRTVKDFQAGKTSRMSNMPRPAGSSWWSLQACFDPGRLVVDGDYANCE